MSEQRWTFRFSDEVRFADLDTLGHLNNVAFLVFFESARVAYIASLVPGHSPADAGALAIVAVEVRISYRAPGRFGERIDTLLRPTMIGRSSFGCAFEMRAGARLLADGEAVMVVYDREAERSMPIPPVMRDALVSDGATARETAARAS